MKIITKKEVKQKFINFFKKQEHAHLPSSSLVPENDDTLMFTNSGMVRFKDYFLNPDQAPIKSAVTIQKCVRAGGKHNDLDNVGSTPRHHTFFEMMGNFSFGDYFKKEAIEMAWNFLTKEVGMNSEKLSITVHEKDHEAFAIWQSVLGGQEAAINKILKVCGKGGVDESGDNWWSAGDVGPCGYCSEIFYDNGPGLKGEPTPYGYDGDRFVEIWNLVFMQFSASIDQSGKRVLEPLAKKCIDTGMGLERLVSVLEGVTDNFETSVFSGIIEKICSAYKVEYNEETRVSINIIADHIRSTAFLIADGVVPSNIGRGYVMRKIMRRAIQHALKLKEGSKLLAKVAEYFIEEELEFYPELIEKKKFILDTITSEEKHFDNVIKKGIDMLWNYHNNIQKGTFGIKKQDLDHTLSFAKGLSNSSYNVASAIVEKITKNFDNNALPTANDNDIKYFLTNLFSIIADLAQSLKASLPKRDSLLFKIDSGFLLDFLNVLNSGKKANKVLEVLENVYVFKDVSERERSEFFSKNFESMGLGDFVIENVSPWGFISDWCEAISCLQQAVVLNKMPVGYLYALHRTQETTGMPIEICKEILEEWNVKDEDLECVFAMAGKRYEENYKTYHLSLINKYIQAAIVERSNAKTKKVGLTKADFEKVIKEDFLTKSEFDPCPEELKAGFVGIGFQEFYDANLKKIKHDDYCGMFVFPKEFYFAVKGKTPLYPTGGGQKHDLGWIWMSGYSTGTFDESKPDAKIANVINVGGVVFYHVVDSVVNPCLPAIPDPHYGGVPNPEDFLRFEEKGFVLTEKDGVYRFRFKEFKGAIGFASQFYVKIDAENRRKTEANHSATHLLHSALRAVLGGHVSQQGSEVDADGLRFDFNHADGALSERQIWQIEKIVNSAILANIETEHVKKNIKDAKAEGAIGLFDAKYGDTVKVMTMDAGVLKSKELCGGTHVKRTGDIGMFKIVQERLIASGIRRIEAVTGMRALVYLKCGELVIGHVKNELRVNSKKIVELDEIVNDDHIFELSKNADVVLKVGQKTADEHETLIGIENYVMKVVLSQLLHAKNVERFSFMSLPLFDMKVLKKIGIAVKSKIETNGLVWHAHLDEGDFVVVMLKNKDYAQQMLKILESFNFEFDPNLLVKAPLLVIKATHAQVDMLKKKMF